MNILIVDDEPRLARVLKMALEGNGYPSIAIATDASDALKQLAARGFDLVVTDLKMPGRSGLELLAEINRQWPTRTHVVLMTAFADVATAREALKRGALDYLVKPFDNAELVALADDVRGRLAAPADTASGEPATPARDRLCGLVGAAPVMQELYRRIERVAKSNAAALILGESGTGKELVARAIHELSQRRGAFVEVDCTTLTDTLVESQLFGHERGAFTGAIERTIGRLELAHDGTAFLDEIGDLPAGLQPKLLRFLQEHRLYRVGGATPVAVDTRIVAATNRDLRAAVRAGRFREDLFYRLDVLTIEVPPLRAHKSDLPLLLAHLLARRGRPTQTVSAAALTRLADYDWPGNVRELENVVEHALIEAGDDPLQLHHFERKLASGRAENVDAPASEDRAESSEGGRPRHSAVPPTVGAASSPLDLATSERQLIERALRDCHGNKSQAAEKLGITRRRLYSRMQLLGIELDRS